MFRKTHKKWWPGCDVYYAYRAGNVPADKFQQLTLPQGIRYIQKYYPKDAAFFSLNQHDFRFGHDGIKQIISAVPEHVTSLSLNCYGFHAYSKEMLQELFAPLAGQITSVFFGYHDYDDEREDYQWTHLKENHPGAEIANLITIMSQLNYKLTAISIDCKLTPNDWRLILQSLSSDTAVLNISPIHALGVDAMTETLQYMPSTVSTLEISRSNLHLLGTDGLARFLQSIPESISMLDLKLNQLHLLGKKGVAKLIAAIPTHLTVKFAYNDLEGLGFESIINPQREAVYRSKC